MNTKPIRVLLVEDNPGDARLMGEMLAEAKGDFDLACASRLSEGLECLAQEGIDAVLLDLGLPDSQGLDTLVRVQAQVPDVPIVVLTGFADSALAVQAVQGGAQDYLVKGELDGNLLTRSLRYAIERQRLLTQLEQARQGEQRERELRSLDQLSSSAQTGVTAEMFGLVPLHQSVPHIFGELVQRYAGLMDLALEQRAYRVEHNISEALRSMAEQTGFLEAGPRDLIEIHSGALREKVRDAPHARAQAYAEEARLMALELMGYLVSFYRTYALAGRRAPGPGTASHPMGSKTGRKGNDDR